MADVHVAVGVRRAVVEDELLAPRAAFAHPLVQPLGFPAREDPRLLLRKAGLHGEIGLRQEDRVSVIALFAHKSARLSRGGRFLQFGSRSRKYAHQFASYAGSISSVA